MKKQMTYWVPTVCMDLCDFICRGKKPHCGSHFLAYVRGIWREPICLIPKLRKMAEVKILVIFYNWVTIYHKLYFCFAFNLFVELRTQKELHCKNKF